MAKGSDPGPGAWDPMARGLEVGEPATPTNTEKPLEKPTSTETTTATMDAETRLLLERHPALEGSSNAVLQAVLPAPSGSVNLRDCAPLPRGVLI